MTIAEMFGQSAVLALLGMSVVFGFLILLVISITIMGKVVRAFGLDKGEQEAASTRAAVAASAGVMDNGVLAAISAAVKEYRKE